MNVTAVRSASRWLVFVPLLAVMFLTGTVFTTQTAAYAATAVTIADTAKVYGPKVAKTVPSVVATASPLGAVVRGAMIAYATQDVWLPFVKGLFGKGGDDPTSSPYAATNVGTIGWTPGLSPAEDDPTLGEQYQMTSNMVSGGPCCYSWTARAPLNIACQSTATGGITYSETYVDLNLIRSGTGTRTHNVGGCPSGSSPVEYHMGAVVYGTQATYNGLKWGVEFPTSAAKFESTATCQRPDGTTFTHTVTATGADLPAGVPMPSCESVTPGAFPQKIVIRGGQTGGTGTMPIIETITPPASPAAYPECGAAANCVLRVVVDGADCTVGGSAACQAWTDTKVNQPERVACYWGPYLVPLADCNGLEGAYEPDGRIIDSETDVDGKTDPVTSTPGQDTTTDPLPTAPQQGGDPWFPSPVPTSEGTTTTTNLDGSETQTQTQIDPATGVKTVTTTTTWPDGSRWVTRKRYPDAESQTPSESAAEWYYPPPTSDAVDDGISGQDCWGAEVRLRDPSTWVTGPVKCALEWAFAVTPATQARFQGVKDLAATKPPGSLLETLGNFANPFGSIGETCPDWTVAVGPLRQNVVCGQGYTERLHAWRDLTGAALVALALAPFLWRVWHAGIPVLNVQPHR